MDGRPLRHSVRSTGWPLVKLMLRKLIPVHSKLAVNSYGIFVATETHTA